MSSDERFFHLAPGTVCSRVAVLEQAFPSRGGNGVFRSDFVKHDLRPWSAPGIELLLTFYMHQLGESIPGLERALIDFPSWTRSILQVKFVEFSADFIGNLVAVKNGQELVEGKVVASHGILAEFG